MKTARRQEPEGGGIVWIQSAHAFHCLGCDEYVEERKRRHYDDPEWVARTKQMLRVDHVECWQFDDPKMAADARRYRKTKKLRENLAAQRVGWRGRQL